MAPSGPSYPSFTKSVDEVEKHYDVSVSRGLSSAQVAAQRSRWGWNELEKEQPTPLWKLVLEQFDDPLVKVRDARARAAAPRRRSPARRCARCPTRAARRMRLRAGQPRAQQRPACAARVTPADGAAHAPRRARFCSSPLRCRLA
jgi:hypothetical protein